TLTAEDKELILKAFVRNREELEQRIMAAKDKEDMILILTEPLCTLDVREQIFRDLTREYEKEGTVFLKPHPRDELDYEKLFSDYPQFDPTIPMEILNYFPGLRFKKVVSVFTETKAIEFADEIVRLGSPFMDKYEDHEVHKLNEGI
ncbi:MAG: lipooligosaccharide sialyltransferase, partial [Lachnospiraceae bacterium]|nr:lipooligosaccharide sialyltransferase [Lachnospiraceae bacterium]